MSDILEAELDQARAEIEEKIRREKSTSVHVAVVGRGGSGKSSLINAIVGRKICEVGAHTDTTTEPQRVDYKQIVFVDLPGYGTSLFSLNDVYHRFNVPSFDVFLCVSSQKFSSDDIDVFKMLLETGKPVLFVRTNCDALNDDDEPIEKVKLDIQCDLNRLLEGDYPVYFVSSRRSHRKTLPYLIDSIAAATALAGRSKSEAFIRAAEAYSKEFLSKKRAAVSRLIYLYAGVSALGGAVPIPGSSVAIDIGVMLKMFSEIRSTYNLDKYEEFSKDEMENKYVNTKNSVFQDLAKVLVFVSKNSVVTVLEKLVGRVAAQEISKYIPFVGSIIAGSLGFYMTKTAGEEYDEICYNTALNILKTGFQI